MIDPKPKTKEKLRAETSRKRRYLVSSQKARFDGQIYRNILDLPEWKKAKNIFIYISTEEEVSTKELIKEYLGKKKIIVPKSHTKFNTLTLHEIKSFDDTAKGHYSILEPMPHTRIVDPKEIDLAIIPGVAFDKKGHRIGYGKAYYDGLAVNLTCPKFGLAYEVQIVDNVPAQTHDVPVNGIITEEAIYRIRN
jgi:5-formyltetrahydrofolate cyclo-ligase